MKKQDLIRAIEIRRLQKQIFEIFNGCEIGVVLTVLDTVIDDLIDLKSFIEKSFIEKSIGGKKNG